MKGKQADSCFKSASLKNCSMAAKELDGSDLTQIHDRKTEVKVPGLKNFSCEE